MPTQLKLQDQTRLNSLEDTIQRGLSTFADVGNALKEIRESRLYREDYVNFEDYCRERWGFSKRHSNRLIEASTVVAEVGPIGPLPVTESQTRELSKLKEPEVMRETWQEITETVPRKKITAKVIRKHIETKAKPVIAARSANFITLDAWNSGERPSATQRLDAMFNRQTNENIEWAKWSWNPVTGCLHGCTYCYARDIANRFYEDLPGDRFAPVLYPSRLLAPENMKSPKNVKRDLGEKNVFTCSMADLFGKWVPEEWIHMVLDSVANAPEWNFLFLTKLPKRLLDFELPENAWFGCTVDTQARVTTAELVFNRIKASVKFVSCEPLLEPVQFKRLEIFDWLIIGGRSASTGAPEFRPPRAWVNSLEEQAKLANCPIYEKTNLLARIKEYPEL